MKNDGAGYYEVTAQVKDDGAVYYEVTAGPTPSPEDLAAVKRLLGSTTLRVWPGQGSEGAWTVEERINTKDASGSTYLYCNCSAWKFGGKKQCKHTVHIREFIEAI